VDYFPFVPCFRFDLKTSLFSVGKRDIERVVQDAAQKAGSLETEQKDGAQEEGKDYRGDKEVAHFLSV
jgi:hypothetical protein